MIWVRISEHRICRSETLQRRHLKQCNVNVPIFRKRITDEAENGEPTLYEALY